MGEATADRAVARHRQEDRPKPIVSRLAALDGVRTVAVLAVVFWHIGQLASPRLKTVTLGGQAGVDMFFVLSGFVITRLLLREHDRAGRIDLTAFLRRRLERLVPALLIVLVVFVPIVALTDQFRHEAKYALLALTYTMDFARAAAAPNHGVSKIFPQTWSLGVEMQFYLVWPLILIAMLGRKRSQLLVVTLGLAALSFAWGAALIAHGAIESNRVYNAPDTRASQLLLGCAVAVALSMPPSQWRRQLDRIAAWLMWPAAAALAYVLIDVPQQLGAADETVLHGLPRNMLVAGVTTATLIYGLVVRPSNPLARILSWRPVSEAGKRYSYALYLWHLPVMYLMLAYIHRSPTAVALLAVVLSCVLSYLSAKFVEDRFNRRRSSAIAPSR